MTLFTVIETVDITKEIPLKYWLVFIAVMAVILPLANKALTRFFIPKNSDEEAPVWSSYSKNSRNRYKF